MIPSNMFRHLFTFVIAIKIIDSFFYKQYDPFSFIIPIRLNSATVFDLRPGSNKQGIGYFFEDKKNKTGDFLKSFSNEFQPYVYKNHNFTDPEFNILFLLL